MKLLPFRKLTYNSPLSENEIRNRLNCLTRAANAFRVKYYPNIKVSDYNGDIYERTFNLSRAIIYRNSFLPAISGTMHPVATGTVVVVTMKLHLGVMIIGGIFAGGLSLAMLATLITNPFNFPGPAAIPFAILIVFALFTTIPFGIEANIAQKDLIHIFECQPE
jgi:hypothetical protein